MSDNIRGALFMMGSMAAFTINDMLIKLVSPEIPLFQMLLLRGLLASLLILILARQVGALKWRFPRKDWVRIGLRTASEIGAAYTFITALRHMPLANVTAVLQVLPLTVALGSAIFLGEQIGWRRLIAILIGFLGMLLIVRPGPDGFSIYSLYALAAVGFVTLRDLSTRRMSAQVPSLTVAVAASVGVTIYSGLAVTGSEWVDVGIRDLALISAASVIILLAYLCSVLVMRSGDVGFIAPFRYTSLIWALFLGVLVFGEWPDNLTLLGAAIVVATGVFTLYRETRAKSPA